MVPDRIAFLGEGKVVGIGSFNALAHIKHPAIQAYFAGQRAQRLLSSDT